MHGEENEHWGGPETEVGMEMAEPLAEKIMAAIAEAAGQYSRLVVVVAPSGAGKTAALQHVCERAGAVLLNVNLDLSRRMLELTETQRALRLPRLLGDIVSETGADVVLLDNIEMLFDAALQQDPLRLLQGLSRNTTVVAAWNGTVDGEHIVYAEQGHPEYRRYAVRDFLLVTPETDV